MRNCGSVLGPSLHNFSHLHVQACIRIFARSYQKPEIPKS